MTHKLRRDRILEILEKTGYVTVQALISELGYSSATVNRDLNAMQSLGLVKRSHGGVEAVKLGHLPPLPQREFYRKKEKRRIAEAATARICNGDTVFLDGSTTVQYMLPFLYEKKDLTVITNSLRLAIELGESPFEVLCLGGRLSERPHVLCSDETVELAMRHFPDKMFFSVGGVTPSGEIKLACPLLYRVMLKNSRERYFLTDRTKLTDRIDEALCNFSSLTAVISDFEFSTETKEKYRGVSFVCTETE